MRVPAPAEHPLAKAKHGELWLDEGEREHRCMTDDDRDDSFLQAVAFVAPVDPGPLERVAIGSVLGDKYLLEEPIGRGGMAHVFAARHQLTGKRVAVKWLRPEFARDEKAARRFVREARAIGSIDHPNVVAVHDAGMHHGSPYLVMELLEGQTLRARMRGRLRETRCCCGRRSTRARRVEDRGRRGGRSPCAGR